MYVLKIITKEKKVSLHFMVDKTSEWYTLTVYINGFLWSFQYHYWFSADYGDNILDVYLLTMIDW